MGNWKRTGGELELEESWRGTGGELDGDWRRTGEVPQTRAFNYECRNVLFRHEHEMTNAKACFPDTMVQSRMPKRAFQTRTCNYECQKRVFHTSTCNHECQSVFFKQEHVSTNAKACF